MRREIDLGTGSFVSSRAAALAVTVLALTTWPTGWARAERGGWRVHLEPGVGVLVGQPQSLLWGVGGGGAAKIEWAMGDRIGLQAEVSGLAFLDGDSPDPALHQRDPGAGGMLLVGAGVRVRPFGEALWLDANVGWVRTGPRDRLGFDAALGLELPVADGFRLGPFAKFVQVVESSSDLQPEDARIAIAGVSFSFGGARVRQAAAVPASEVPIAPEERPAPARAARAPLPLPPPQTGERDEEADLLLAPRVLFETARAVVRAHCHDEIRAVQAVLEAHPEYLRIRVEGHADERGTDEYNDWLSMERARRSAAWLERYGVDAARIEVVAHGRRIPAVPGRSLYALRQNRRVRFRIVLVRRTVEVDAPAPAPVQETP